MTCTRQIDRADRATYLDFEGRTHQPPVLAGILTVEPNAARFRQVVLDAKFAPAAEAKGVTMATLDELVEELIVEAEALDRPIVGWSHQEIEVVEAYSPMVAERFRAQYVDAKAAAKSARRRGGLDLPDAWGDEFPTRLRALPAPHRLRGPIRPPLRVDRKATPHGRTCPRPPWTVGYGYAHPEGLLVEPPRTQPSRLLQHLRGDHVVARRLDASGSCLAHLGRGRLAPDRCILSTAVPYRWHSPLR